MWWVKKLTNMARIRKFKYPVSRTARMQASTSGMPVVPSFHRAKPLGVVLHGQGVVRPVDVAPFEGMLGFELLDEVTMPPQPTPKRMVVPALPDVASNAW